MAYRWIESLRSFVYPPTCLLCDSKGHKDLDLCQACADDLPRLEHSCGRCALPVEQPNVSLCGACQRRPPAFGAAHALYRFQPPVSYLVHQLKFHGKLSHARLLVCLLAEHLLAILSDLPEFIVQVPLHPKRVRERGFNQALELARHVGRRLEVPVDRACARRIRHTDPQTDLSAKLRRKNIRDAFEVRAPFATAHVAIVDDVITTGATVDELARALQKAGAQRVDVWCIARA